MLYVRTFRVIVSELQRFEIQANEVHQLDDRVVFLKTEPSKNGELVIAVFFNSAITGWCEILSEK